MTRAAANGIDIEYDTFGDRSRSPLLLIMGLSSQMEAMLSPPPQDRDGYIQHAVEVFHAFSGGSDRFDETLERELAANSYDRSFYPIGFTRQVAAILASGDRTQSLASVTAPTLVIHGADDPLVTPAHGRATARAIPRAKLLVLEGLGHGIAYPALWDQIVGAIAQHTSIASGRERIV